MTRRKDGLRMGNAGAGKTHLATALGFAARHLGNHHREALIAAAHGPTLWEAKNILSRWGVESKAIVPAAAGSDARQRGKPAGDSQG